MAPGFGSITAASGSLNIVKVKTYPSGCKVTDTISVGGDAKIADAELAIYPASQFAFAIGETNFVRSGTYTTGVVTGPSRDCNSPGATLPWTGAAIPMGWPKFALPSGPPKTLSLSKTTQEKYQNGPTVDWTLTLNLTPVFWCQPGKRVSHHIPAGAAPTPIPAAAGKPWSITFGDLFLNYTTAAGGGFAEICVATAPEASLPVRMTPQNGPVTLFAEITGKREIIVFKDFRNRDRYFAYWYSNLRMDFMSATGPIANPLDDKGEIFAVELADLQVSPATNTMDEIVRAIEDYAYTNTFLGGHLRHALTYWTLIQDPGSVSLAVVDNNGRTTGRLPDGRTTTDIPGSFYIPPSDTNPAVVWRLEWPTEALEVLLHGLDTGPYSLAISTARGAIRRLRSQIRSAEPSTRERTWPFAPHRTPGRFSRVPPRLPSSLWT